MTVSINLKVKRLFTLKYFNQIETFHRKVGKIKSIILIKIGNKMNKIKSRANNELRKG